MVATLAAFAEALPDPFIVVDDDMRIVVANRRANTLAPLSRAGAPLLIAIRTPDVVDAAARVIAGGEAEKVSWYERVPAEQLIEVHVTPVELDARRYAVIVMRDISQSIRLERMRVDFVANASHELRTPLASLLGFVETLQGPARNDPAARDRFLSVMREQGRRMARLLDDLLHLSRIEQAQNVPPTERVDLAGVVLHVVDTLSHMAEEAGVTISLDLPTTLEVLGARDELIRVAENLIENAVKYGVDSKVQPPRVEVSLKEHDGDAVLTVRDFGPGIAAEHLPRLTERFYRVDASASRAKGGTGLGLALVKHIAAHHRGRLGISSVVGEGAEFRFMLPLAREIID